FALRCKMGPPSRAFWSPQRPWSLRNLKRRRPCPQCRLVVAWTTNIDQWTRRLGPDLAPGLFLSTSGARTLFSFVCPARSSRGNRRHARKNTIELATVMSLRKMRHLSSHWARPSDNALLRGHMARRRVGAQILFQPSVELIELKSDQAVQR